MELNKIQTPINDDLKKHLDKDVYSDLIDAIENIEFAKRLVSPSRKYARDLERDEFGRIIIDVINPHILEDMKYFCQARMYFETNECYTNIIPNAHPLSEYSKFWTEEARRCREGLVRESDGEWITGLNYFYWNYSPILKSETRADGRTVRVSKFPSIWDGDYLYFHYIEQARTAQKHCNVLKSRGKGFSFKGASVLCKFLLHGDRQDPVESQKKQKAFTVANEKEFLTKDAILNKFLDVLTWTSKETPWPRNLLKESMNDMHWRAGYINSETGKEEGVLNEVVGVTLKNDADKARGKRGAIILWEEMGKFPDLLKAWSIARPSVEDGDKAFGTMIAFGTGGCLTAGNKVWNNLGELINIEDIDLNNGIIGFNKLSGASKEDITYWQAPTKKECVKITTNTRRFIECSIDHPIYTATQKNNYIIGNDFIEASNLKIGNFIATIDEVNIWSDKKLDYAREIGWLIGDGTYGNNQSVRIANCEHEILSFLEKNHDCKTNVERLTKLNKVYKELRIKGFGQILRNVGIFGQTKLNKTLPKNIHSYSKESVCELIGGLFDTDGYISFRPTKRKNGQFISEVSISQASESLLLELQLLLQKIGVHSSIRKRLPRLNNPKDKNPWYELCIRDAKSLIKFHNNIKLFVTEKQKRLNDIFNYSISLKTNSYDNLRYEKIVSIENTGIKEVYNLTANKTHTYIGNGIITHNTEGADFRAAEEMFYNTSGYNILGLNNVFDKNANIENKCAFFFPEYINRADCYDENGNSDIVKALIQIFKNRLTVKYGTSDPNALTQEKAERPIYPQEAILRKEGSLFPISELKDYISEIMPNIHNFVAPHYVGRIGMQSNGNTSFVLDHSINVIRDFPLKDNLNKYGAVEIFKQPVKLYDGTIPRNRYIMGVDPVDDDYSQTNSLVSAFVFDRLLDIIVAEYTGRPRTAAEAYDIIYRLARYYNAKINYENDKKGLFAHFSTLGALHLLAETPSILKDMEIVKETRSYGNKSLGTPSGVAINALGRRLQADWLVSKAIGSGVQTINDNGELVDTEPVMNLHRLRSIGYIKELIAWNPDGNFDRISAMGMCMIYRLHLLKYDTKDLMVQKKTIIDNDPFFNRYANKKSYNKNF